jgi:hypothetical protein
VREFLDDLPRDHCTTKPPHEYCTVCMRINYLVANDCPLYHVKPPRKLRSRLDGKELEHEPLTDHLTKEDVAHALKGEDFPIIEFAGPRGTGRPEADEEEEVLEVKPIEVKPLAKTPPRVKKVVKRPVREEPMVPKPEDASKEEAPRAETPTTSLSKTDVEELMQGIMQELEFPDEEELEEEAELPPVDEEETGEVPKGGKAPEGSGDAPPHRERRQADARRRSPMEDEPEAD